jgi:hypothetical protein
MVFGCATIYVVGDSGQFDPERPMHKLDIITSDGRRAMAEISHAALCDDDPWNICDDSMQLSGCLGGGHQSEGCGGVAEKRAPFLVVLSTKDPDVVEGDGLCRRFQPASLAWAGHRVL